MQRVVIYTPLEDILYNQGGLGIMLLFMLAALIGVGVYVLIERTLGRYTVRGWGRQQVGTPHLLVKYNGWISCAVGLGSLYLVHLANIKGWI